MKALKTLLLLITWVPLVVGVVACNDSPAAPSSQQAVAFAMLRSVEP